MPFLAVKNPPGPPEMGDAVVEFTNASESLNEPIAATTKVVSLTRSVDTSESCSVLVTSSNGSAVAGTHFTAVSETVTFGVGVTTQNVNVSMLSAPASGAADTWFALTISVPDNCIVGGQGSVNVTLVGQLLLRADFNNSPLGVYTSAQAQTDFNVNALGYNDAIHVGDELIPSTSIPNELTNVVLDPVAGAARGRVLETVQLQGRAGRGTTRGGFEVRGDFTGRTRAFFCYGMLIEAGFDHPKQLKMPCLWSKDILTSGHASGETPSPAALLGFNARIQSHGNSAFGRGDGSLGSVVYDKRSTQSTRWCNTDEPNNTDFSTATAKLATQFLLDDYGVWHDYEVEVDILPVNGTGIMRIWVDTVLRYEHAHFWLDDGTTGNGLANDDSLIDGIRFNTFYGGATSDPENQPDHDQKLFFSELIVSTVRINP
ncbi:MAG: hypothetical protein JKY96_04440 [Phycisphaerales bacterium]|nr:hypothetical protein [Phycisphaerales bacterium]